VGGPRRAVTPGDEMTQHQGRKRLIRERMSRTGESYTTARRHVLTGAARDAAPALPAGVLPGYDTFGGGQHHESTLLAHVLRQQEILAPHTGEPFSEAMMCGLGGGIGFMYAVFEYQGTPPIMTIVAQHHPEPWAPAVLGRLDVPHTEEHSTSPARAMAGLRRELDGGRPVWCTVARNFLPWHAGAHAAYTDPYPVVVAGIDGELLHLDDGAVTPRTIDLPGFGAAWAAHRKGRHHRLVATGQPRAKLTDAVRAAIATTVAHLTGPVLGHSFDGNFGFSGMSRLAAQLRDTRTKSAWVRRFITPEAVGLVLMRLAECLEEQYTAPGATRPLYADFLDEAAGVVGDDRLPVAAGLFRQSGELWSRIAARAQEELPAEYAEAAERRMACFLGGRAVDEPAPPPALDAVDTRALFTELADLVDAARDAEERAVAQLAR